MENGIMLEPKKASELGCLVKYFGKFRHTPKSEIVYLDMSVNEMKEVLTNDGYIEKGLKMGNVMMIKSKYDILTIQKIDCLYLK